MKNNSILKNPVFACAAAVFCTLLWGTAFPFIKLGYSAFAISDGDIGTKILFAGIRFLLAGIMVYIFLCISQKRLAVLPKGDFSRVLALGFVQTSMQYIFTYIGIGLTSGTNTSIITSCASFITVLCAPLFFKNDRLSVLKILGCLLGFSGVIAINGFGGLSLDTLFGDILIFMSTLCAAGGNIISKKLAKGRNPVELTAFQLVFGGLLLTIVGLILGGGLDFGNANGILILLWLSVVSAVAFTIWTALLKYHPASKITIFNLLVPIFGTVLSGFMLGENIFRTETLISLILISLGIAAVNINLKAKNKNGKF